ncbi:MAG: hypothetical protein AB7O67_19755 [Vicinamibacterales bacterium]
MTTAADDDREARSLEQWFISARDRQRAFGDAPPQLVVPGARAMRRLLGPRGRSLDETTAEMAFWQVFLPSAINSDLADFRSVRQRLPRSFAAVRDGITRSAAPPQVVFATFHIAAFHLVAALVASALEDVCGERGHVLIARRNMGWLQLQAGRWVHDAGQVLTTDAAGLRQLHRGLRDGSIRRLFILVDGPHPAKPGVHPLQMLDGSMGFKTGLLTRLLEWGIPILPLVHGWSAGRLAVEWHPRLEPGSGIQVISDLADGLLRAFPEQWLNWSAVSRFLEPGVSP